LPEESTKFGGNVQKTELNKMGYSAKQADPWIQDGGQDGRQACFVIYLDYYFT